MLVRFGIELATVYKGSTPSLAYDGERENVMFNATDAAKRYLKADAHHWNMGSGAPTRRRGFLRACGRAHGREAVERGGAVRRTNVRGARVGTDFC